MSTNHYFQAGLPMGRTSEQLLYEDIIIECLSIYGHDVYYLPRQTYNKDLILNEDALSNYSYAYAIEMYLTDVTGFQGEGDLLSKFGVELRDTANFIVARRRWDEIVARDGEAQLTTRPAEGDLIYFPRTTSLFEIRRVDTSDPFYQVNKLYVFTLQCELVQYSSEVINTGIDEIDQITDDQSLDIGAYEVLLENGDAMLLEYETNASLILESFTLSQIDPAAQNDKFETEIDILDFTDRNPFGEVYNQ